MLLYVRTKCCRKKFRTQASFLFNPGCTCYTAFVTLNAEKHTESNVTHLITTVDLEDSCIPDLFKTTRSELLPITIRNVPLDAMNVIKDQIPSI